jgi:hypothetical protein
MVNWPLPVLRMPATEVSRSPTAWEMETRSGSESGENDNAEPPDGGYGWFCVMSCFLINCFTWGMNKS